MTVTEEDVDELEKALDRKFGEQSQSLFQFLTNVVKADDTTRIGNVTGDELGMSNLPIRTHQELSLLTKDDPEFGEYFKEMSQIVTDTSLSKDGFLVRQATIQRKEFSDKTKTRKENKGWFKRSETKEGEENT